MKHPWKALRKALPRVSREDVVWCYRHLLGREPDSEEAILYHQEARTFRGLVRRIVDLPEYSANKPASDGPPLKILLLGGCQTIGLARLMQAMARNVAASPLQLSQKTLHRLRGEGRDLGALAAEHDLVLVQLPFADALRTLQDDPRARDKAKPIPGVHFSAFHPDLVYVNNAAGGFVAGPMGDYQSSIAFHGWREGLGVAETVGLFNEDVFAALGFFDYWESSLASLAEMGREAGLPLEGLPERWTAHGCWMHSINHPKLLVLEDIARAILEREGIAVRQEAAGHSIHDNLADGPVWPVYPEIGRRLGVPGSYRFIKTFARKRQTAPVIGLEEFVRESFDAFSHHRRENLSCERLDSPRYRALGGFLKNRGRAPAKPAAGGRAGAAAGANPYRGLPDRQFWRRAVAGLPPAEVDPADAPRFALPPGAKVATAGSCFAQHLAGILLRNGLNYYVAEGAGDLPAEEARRRNYGVFSARYGNVYTAAQLVQLFDRAYGAFTPQDRCWTRPDGRLADPFRPQIEPDGFASPEELEASRAAHLQAVREMFESLDVFVFTLGLTEAWRSRADGAVYPLAPGVAAGEFDPAAHEFVNFGAAEVAADLQAFLDRLAGVNPRARTLLTVSPVPLIATYEDRHALTATAYSKAVLRVAADEAARRNPRCEYFPAYEIITGHYNRGAYFEDDLRAIRPEGVEHVMRVFVAHYAAGGRDSFAEERLRENAAVGKVVCDEEAIDAGGPGAND